jgi:chromate transporter
VSRKPRGPHLRTPPTFAEAFRFWLKLGFISFGGPAGQIAIMHEELVERRRWITAGRFLHALNYCMLLPGPEAQQLAIYVGWLLHKVRGGLLAGIAFILPAFFLIWGSRGSTRRTPTSKPSRDCSSGCRRRWWASWRTR